jgi:hypothetical protein
MARVPEQTGFVACPSEDGEWKVIIALRGALMLPECLSFEALTLPAVSGAAWEYT